jgi:hypothetical protein
MVSLSNLKVFVHLINKLLLLLLLLLLIKLLDLLANLFLSLFFNVSLVLGLLGLIYIFLFRGLFLLWFSLSLLWLRLLSDGGSPASLELELAVSNLSSLLVRGCSCYLR